MYPTDPAVSRVFPYSYADNSDFCHNPGNGTLSGNSGNPNHYDLKQTEFQGGDEYGIFQLAERPGCSTRA